MTCPHRRRAPSRRRRPRPTSRSSKDLDTQVELSGHSAKDFEITFERFLASLYMTAMLQLGLMRQQGGQPQVDIIGARQTIDTLSLISEKTKGNLTPAEENFLQNSLYELRMAYVEVTNALARPPQPDLPPEPPEDESNLDRAGQWDVDGRAHAGMRLRRLPFQRSARPADAALDHARVRRQGRADRHHARFLRAGGPRERSRSVDAVLYTHTHADHILGIDDLRPLSYRHKPDKLPLYARPDAAAFLRRMFSYIFDADYKFGGLPLLELRPIDGPVDRIRSAIRAGRSSIHGETQIYGYRFGSAAYLTDHSEIPESSMHQLEGLDILFLDALRHKPHPTHSTVKNSLAIVERVETEAGILHPHLSRSGSRGDQCHAAAACAAGA